MLAGRIRSTQGNQIKGQHLRVLLPLCCTQMSFHPVYQHLVRAGESLDLALMSLGIIDLLDDADSADRLSDWSEHLAAHPSWAGALGDRERAVLEPWIDSTTRLRRRLSGRPYNYGHRQYRDIQVLARLTFEAIDLDGNRLIEPTERKFLDELFRVVNLVGDDEEATGAAARLATPTLGAHAQKAREQGVGDSYRKLLAGLRPSFGGPVPNRSSVAICAPRRGRPGRLPTLMRVFPERSGTSQGICCEVELQRLTDHLGCDAGELEPVLARTTDECDRWDPGANRFVFHLLDEDIDDLLDLLGQREESAPPSLLHPTPPGGRDLESFPEEPPEDELGGMQPEAAGEAPAAADDAAGLEDRGQS